MRAHIDVCFSSASFLLPHLSHMQMSLCRPSFCPPTQPSLFVFCWGCVWGFFRNLSLSLSLSRGVHSLRPPLVCVCPCVPSIRSFMRDEGFGSCKGPVERPLTARSLTCSFTRPSSHSLIHSFLPSSISISLCVSMSAANVCVCRHQTSSVL